eukprot:gene5999-2916_t
MPFDGILVATRMGACLECNTSPGAKQLLVNAPGIPEAAQHTWEKSYKGPVGGIMTVTSELGEPIHKVANRGIQLWKELDETVFSLPKEKQRQVLKSKRDYIVQRLNADWQKPYFPCKLSGEPCEVADMTYEEVTRRLITLMYVPAKGSAPDASPTRWINPTLRAMAARWMRRVEERFCKAGAVSMLATDAVLDSPLCFADALLDFHPPARSQPLCSEDVDYFMSLCATPRQKPVPFIPALDDRFVVWFKKDSLWQCEDVDAVVGRDAQRVAILAGPVSVHHIKKVDEPAKEILDGIYFGWVERLKAARGGAADEVEWVGCRLPAPPSLPPSVRVGQQEGVRTFSIPSDGALPAAAEWLNAISGEGPSWLKALLCSAD